MQHSDAFRAMDTDIDVLVEAEARPLAAFFSLRILFEQQEEKFSRFRPHSLLSRLNAGETVEDVRFAQACRLAMEGHRITGGLYNPMVLPALVQAGYGTTFTSVSGGEPVPHVVPDPGACMVVDGHRVSLHEGALDLGGIVKGWTVDLGIEMLRGDCPDLFINAGGDLRCTGSEEGVDGWLVAVDSPIPDRADPWEGPVRGAVATSSTLKRQWRTASGGLAHHLIDPRTGMPAESPFVQVTVWGEEVWRAEVWAKAVLIGGETAAAAARAHGHRVLAVRADGSVLGK